MAFEFSLTDQEWERSFQEDYFKDVSTRQDELSAREIRSLDDWEAQEHLAEEYPEPEAAL